MTWRNDAACRGMPVSEFVILHPRHKWSRQMHAKVARALEVCASCPVRTHCEAEAQRHGSAGVIFGGRLPDELPSAIVAMPEPAPQPVVDDGRLPARNREQCGTYYGYILHLRKFERTCPVCRKANADYRRQSDQRRRGVA